LGLVFVFASVVWLGRLLQATLANPNQPANLIVPVLYGLVWLATGMAAFVWGTYPALFAGFRSTQPSADCIFEKLQAETRVDRNASVAVPASRNEALVPAIFFSIMAVAATLAGMFYDDQNAARGWIVFGRGLSLGVACFLVPMAAHYLARLALGLPLLRLSLEAFEVRGVWRRRRVPWLAIRQIDVRPASGIMQVVVNCTAADGHAADLGDVADAPNERVLRVRSVYGFSARDLANLLDRCRSWATDSVPSKAP
jgi:hypothetical protein